LNNNLNLLIATPRSQAPILRELRYEVLPPLIQVGCITSILTLLLAYWIARWVASPLQRISKAAIEVASGEYQTIPLEGPSEVQTLSLAFNEMSERVKTSQQSQRDLVANVSHELKTPLTSIQGFAQAILDGTANTKDELHQAASVIYTEASRMYRLVLDLLDLARMDSGIAEFKREGVNLERLLQGVAEKFTPQARQAQVNLQVDIGPLASFIGDEDRLNQVFTNLVDNALKITPENGSVILRARQVDGMVEVSVSDTGPGIPPQELSRIFERFY
jgi:signal transduction histidine kinase